MVVITPIDIEKAENSTPELGRGTECNLRSSAVVCSLVLAAADVLAFAVSFGIAIAITGQLDPRHLQSAELGSVLGLGILSLGGVMLAFVAWSHYARRQPRLTELRDIALSSFVALLATGYAEFMLRLQDPRTPSLMGWGLFVPAVVVFRMGARLLLRKAGLWERRAVVVGYGETASETAHLLASYPSMGYAIAAVVHPAMIGPVQNGRWSTMLESHKAELVVVAVDDAPRDVVESLVRDRVPFAMVSRTNGLPVFGCTKTCFIGRDAVIRSYQDNLGQPVARAAKICMDVAGAVAMLLVLAPVLVLIALAIKLDGGPVLYAHRRLGVGGRSFPCLKFRSMVVNSDEVLARVLSTDPDAAAEWAATRKLRRDPRVTWIGRILRQTSLDELPQLLNVLRLDMSLVGPRPIVSAEVPRYGWNIQHYYATRPGLTGLWQVSGRSDTGYTERVQLDTWYVKNWSFWYDLVILAKTVPAVLQRRGAV